MCYKKYIFDATYEWLLKKEFTPYVTVSTLDSEVQVPMAYVRNNLITLNIAPAAINDFMAGNKISFSARFSGKKELISFPIEAVVALTAKENNSGCYFQGGVAQCIDITFSEAESENPKRATLKVVK